MSTQATGITAGVPDEWLEDHLATVFSRWHTHLSAFGRESNEVLIAVAGVQPHDTVLDVACGSGEISGACLVMDIVMGAPFG